MLECETAMAGAALLLYRMLRVGELLALVAFLSWSSWYVPSAVAAVLRLAGSLLLNARFVFVLGNAIVLLLFALSRLELSPGSSSNDEQQPAASTATTPQQASSMPPVAAAGASSFPSFTTQTTLAMGDAAASFATPAAPPPPAMEEALREGAVPAPEPRAAATVLEDKQPVRVSVNKARAPRRSRSEKMGSRLVALRAASPELRRCESENGRRRRSSVTARDAEACWGREDADEFRRQVEAFIARQTRFHREESMTMAGHCEAAPAFTGALTVVE